jgi:S-adenosylmethionine hydrolase
MRGMDRTARPVIGFLTDFGLDGAAATCRGVILGICREAQIVDICHTVRKYAISDGSYLLAGSLPYLPVGVHVAVVDPGVGTQRRPIAIATRRGDVLVGPDNGLLIEAAEALGGIDSARILENRAFWLPETSSTFHARDVFAPVAAHLAAGGASVEELGPAIGPADLVRLHRPAVRAADGVLDTFVTYVDSFGNLRMAGSLDDLRVALPNALDGARLTLEFRGGESTEAVRDIARFARTFGEVDPGSSLLYVDSSGRLALADNQGNAAARLGVTAGIAVRITRT